MTPEQTTEMLALQAALAYSAARSDIECHCQPVGEFTERWHDPRGMPGEDREFIAAALRYLDLRGLIERHENGVWVRVRDAA